MVSDSDSTPAQDFPVSPPRRVLVVGGAGGVGVVLTAALAELGRRQHAGELERIVLVDATTEPMDEKGFSELTHVLTAAHVECEVFLEGDNRPSWQKMNDEPWRQRRSRKMGR